MWEELSHVLFAWCGKPAQKLCLKPIERLLLRWESEDVYHIGRFLLVELWNQIINLGMLTCGVFELELRLSLDETDGLTIVLEERQPHSDSLHRWADSLVFSVPHAVKCIRVARWCHKYIVENEYTNKHINENYEGYIRKFQRFVTCVIFVVFHSSFSAIW